MARTKQVTAPAPFLPPDYQVADACALQALVKGEATPDQQKRAINWIVNEACDTYGFQYRTDPCDHAFGSGRRFSGQQIVND